MKKLKGSLITVSQALGILFALYLLGIPPKVIAGIALLLLVILSITWEYHKWEEGQP